MSFVTHLESALDGTPLPADRPQTLHNGRAGPHDIPPPAEVFPALPLAA
jgi:hypothetical protein